MQKVLNDLCGKMCCSLGDHDNFSRLAVSVFGSFSVRFLFAIVFSSEFSFCCVERAQTSAKRSGVECSVLNPGEVGEER